MDVSEEIERLVRLHHDGHLSDEEFARAKAAVLTGEPAAGGAKISSQPARRRLVVVAGGVIALALVATTAVWWSGRDSHSDAASVECDNRANQMLSEGTPNADLSARLEQVGCGWWVRDKQQQAESGDGAPMDDIQAEDAGPVAPPDTPAETSAPSDTEPTGALGDEVGWEDGTYTVLSVKKFKPTEFAIGAEPGTESIEVKVKFRNPGNTLASASVADVKLLVGPNENEATRFIDGSANEGNGSGLGWSGADHRAGEGEVATFAFQARPQDVSSGTCVVVIDRGFVGTVRVEGSFPYGS